MSILLGSGTNATAGTQAVGVTLQSSVQGSAVPFFYGQTRLSGNLCWYGGFQSQQVNSGGGKGGGGGKNGSGQYDYHASFLFVICSGEASILTVYPSKAKQTFAQSGLGFFPGSYTQSVWGYLETNFSSQALAYRGLCYAYGQIYDLGNSAQLPNFGYEMLRSNTISGLTFSNAIPGQPDADPASVVYDFLTNPYYGVGFPSARIPDIFTVFSSYCRAVGMVSSPLYDSQQDAATWLDDYVQQHNSQFVWSGDTLTIVPYGDQSITANGATYTAPSAPLYSLDDDDFLKTGSTPPVQLQRARPSDRYNIISLEWLDRTNRYNTAVVTVYDEAHISRYGKRPATSQESHYFCTLAAATMSATLQMQRQAIRNTYTFTLGWRYCLLDPMDIVEITDTALGLVNQWVRITSITEDETGNLQVTAEEYLDGTGAAPLYSFQTGAPYAADYNSDPGSPNTPVIFEPPAVMTKGVPQICVGASGGSNYGGCDIWLSLDNSSYSYAGTLVGQSRQGVLTATLAAGSDPDTTHTLSVSLLESNGILNGGTMSDADNFLTLAYVDTELISYQTATLTGPSAYNLTYLRRGVFGTENEAHSSGAPFLRIDTGVAFIDLPITPVSYIGKTVYVKLLPFNIFGGGKYELSDVTAITVTPTGVGAYVAPPTGATITPTYQQAQDGTVNSYFLMSWTASPDLLFDHYQVEVALHGTTNWTGYNVSASVTSFRFGPYAEGTAYDFQVRAVRTQGGTYYSTWDQVLNSSTTGKTTSSEDPTSFTAAGTYQSATLNWVAPTATDIAWIEVWQSSDSTLADATKIAQIQTNAAVINNLANSTTYYFWLRSINRSGVPGNFVGPEAATTTTVGTMGISPDAVVAVGAVNVPGSTYSGSPSWQNIGSTSITLNVSSSVCVFANISQGFSSGPKITGLRLLIDGTEVTQIGPGTAELFERNLGITQYEFLSAATHTFEMDWYAEDSTVTLTGGALIVLGPQR